MVTTITLSKYERVVQLLSQQLRLYGRCNMAGQGRWNEQGTRTDSYDCTDDVTLSDKGQKWTGDADGQLRLYGRYNLVGRGAEMDRGCGRTATTVRTI